MQVCFGIATYEKNVCIDFLDSMMRTIPELVARNWEIKVCVVAGNCFIDMARNDIVRHFLSQTQADSLFFIDQDQGWDPMGVVRLLEHPAEVVGGVVPKKCEPVDYNIGGLTGAIEHDWLEISEVGTGFMRIKREVFARLDEAFPEYKELHTISGSTPYFQSGFYNSHFTGEDVFFCRQWRKAGGKCWIYPDINFKHRGHKVWDGNFHKYALEKQLYTVRQ